MFLHRLPSWLMYLAITALVTCLLLLVFHRMTKRTRKDIPPKAVPFEAWPSVVLHSSYFPGLVFIGILGLTFCLEIMARITKEEVFLEYIIIFRRVSLVVIIGWFFWRVVDNGISYLHQKSLKKIESPRLIAQGLKITILILTFITVLQTLGLPLSGFLTVSGIGGVAIGFAAKDVLANIFGSMMIYFERPFEIGDTIKSTDRGLEGTIEGIGWRVCRLRTPEKRLLYVPNSFFSSLLIENVTRMTHRRIKTTMIVRHEDAEKLPALTKDVLDFLLKHPQVDASLETQFSVVEITTKGIVIQWACYVLATDAMIFNELEQILFLEIFQKLCTHQVQFAPHLPPFLPIQDH